MKTSLLTLTFLGLIHYAAAAPNARSAQAPQALPATIVLPQSMGELRVGLANNPNIYLGAAQPDAAALLGNVIGKIEQAHPGSDAIYTSHGDRAVIFPHQALAAQDWKGHRNITMGVYNKRTSGRAWHGEFAITQKGAKDMLARLSRGDVMGVYAKLQQIFDLNERYSAWRTAIAAQFVTVEPGTFQMGSPNNEAGRFGDEALHTVKLTHRIQVQATHTTQNQFLEAMNYNPSYFQSQGLSANYPVENITWYEAVEYLNKLSELSGLQLAYEIIRGRNNLIHVRPTGKNNYETAGYEDGINGYRLPTEAELEYMARAGSSSPYPFNEMELGHYAWYSGNSDGGTHTVATRKPNALGIYDAIGNVYSWAYDWHGDYPTRAVTDPTGPKTGSLRVVRGGSYSSDVGHLRSALRVSLVPGARWRYVGLRVVRSIR